VGVVTGGKSASQRDQKMVKLLDKHFGVESKQIKTKKLAPKIVSNYKKKKYAAGG
jgi:D-alanyl-D-alanine carboxypeptidase